MRCFLLSGGDYVCRLGIAHRDVKPENILCTYPDQTHPVKLCDLDLASKIQEYAGSVTTPELLSPVGKINDVSVVHDSIKSAGLVSVELFKLSESSLVGEPRRRIAATLEQCHSHEEEGATLS